MTYIDSYSVEPTSISPSMVLQAQSENKKIYGWTANSVKTIKKLLKCNVDGLLTDNILLAAYCLETKEENELLELLTELFFPE